MNLGQRVERLEEKVGAGGGCDACAFPAGGMEILIADFVGHGWQVRDSDRWPPGGEDGDRLNRVCQECGREYQAVLLRWPAEM